MRCSLIHPTKAHGVVEMLTVIFDSSLAFIYRGDCTLIKTIGKITGLASMALPILSMAQIDNGSFEDGSLSGWTVQAGVVEAIQRSNFDHPVALPDGTYYALLSTTPDAHPGLDSGKDRDNFEGNEHDPAILSQTFAVANPPEELSFSVAMLTSEESIDTSADIFECLLDGAPLIQGASSNAAGGSSFPYAGTFDGTAYTVTSSGAANASVFRHGLSGFQTVKIMINTSGSHTLECFIGDGSGDGTLDSGLLLDDVRLTAPPAPPAEPQQIPSLSTWGLLLLSGLLGIMGLMRRRKV